MTMSYVSSSYIKPDHAADYECHSITCFRPHQKNETLRCVGQEVKKRQFKESNLGTWCSICCLIGLC